jgi:alkylation response protein AidB-like acyl-CoA dehydrogenase
VDLLPSSDQLDLTRTTAAFLAEQIPVSTIRRRRGETASISAKMWRACAELGLLGLSAAEDAGGSGLGVDDEALVFRELGRGLAAGPFVSSVLAARLAERAGDLALAGSIVAGEVTVGLARRRTATGSGDPVQDGAFYLFDAPDAAFVLLAEDGGAGLVAVSELSDVEPASCLDPGVRLATAVASGVRPALWRADAAESINRHGQVLVSAMLVGIAEAARDMSVEHAKNRVQFGRPIGVNQAVKHACADMAVDSEAALQQTLFAAIGLRSGRPDAEFSALSAKVVAARAAIGNARSAIQVFGGMGYTDEQDAHLFLRRAHVLDQWFGTRTGNLARLLAQEVAQ